jgi:hypothetical protein
MLNFILGIIIGGIGIWFTALNPIRFAIHKEKLKAYSEISNIATKIFDNATYIVRNISGSLEKATDLQLQMIDITGKYMYVINEDIKTEIYILISTINKTKPNIDIIEINTIYTKLINLVRTDLSIDKLESIEKILLLKNDIANNKSGNNS